jgi:O-antigen ligase
VKEIVLTLHKSELRLNEASFTNFFVKPAFVLLIFFGFYSRTEGLLGLSGGQLSVVVSFGLFALSVFHLFFINKEKKVSQFTWFIILFFVISGVIPLITAYIFVADPSRIFRFSFEIGITFFMFFPVYYFLKERIISIKFFLLSLAILGFIASFPLLYNVIGAVRIRRVGGLGGSNYLGSSYAIAAISWVFILYLTTYREVSNKKRYAFYSCLFITLLALLLTGTRAAAVAFMIGLMMFQILGMKSRKFTKYLFSVAIIFVGFLVYLSLYVDLSLLVDRYSYEQLSRMAGIRYEIYAMSVTDLTIVEFLFGRPDFYLFSEGDSGVNPHNLFLAIIRYNGLIPFMMFMVIFGVILYKYLMLYMVHKNKPELRAIESTIIVLFTMILIYTVFSGGRFTRSFAFYIILGYSVGYFELLSKLKSYDDYKSLLF